MAKRLPFTPNWYEQRRPDRSYRSLFKWGDPEQFKHPNRGLMELACQALGMKEEDFGRPVHMGLGNSIERWVSAG
jgi:alkyldihydroxyacetonephosphate synthase